MNTTIVNDEKSVQEALFGALQKLEKTEQVGQFLRRLKPADSMALALALPLQVESELCAGVAPGACADLVALVRAGAHALRSGQVRDALLGACEKAQRLCDRKPAYVMALLVTGNGSNDAKKSADCEPLLVKSQAVRPGQKPGVTRRVELDSGAVQDLKGALGDAAHGFSFKLDAVQDVQGTSWMLAGAIRAIQLMHPDAWKAWLVHQTGQADVLVGATGEIRASGEVLRVESVVEKVQGFLDKHPEALCFVPAANIAELKQEKGITDACWKRIVSIHHVEELLWKIELVANQHVSGTCAAWFEEQMKAGRTRVDCVGNQRALNDSAMFPLTLIGEQEKSVEDFVARVVSSSEQGGRHLVLSSPGAGKSFTLAKIHGALLASGRALSCWVSAHELNRPGHSYQSGQGILEFLGYERFSWLEAELQGKEAAMTLCIDGLDELSPLAFRRLTGWVSEWPGTVIATARQHLAGAPELVSFTPWQLQLNRAAAATVLQDIWQRPDLAAMLLEEKVERRQRLDQLLETPLGLALLLAEQRDQGLDSQALVARHIAGRVRTLFEQGRISNSVWTWWRTVGPACIGQASLRMFACGASTLEVEHFQHAGVSDESLQRAVDFLDAGAITEPVDERAWAVLHRTFAESFAGKALATAGQVERTEILAKAVGCTSQSFDELFRWAAMYLEDATAFVQELLEEAERPVSALRLAAILAKDAALTEPEVALLLVDRLLKVGSKSVRADEPRPGFLVGMSAFEDVLRRQKKLLQPYWREVLARGKGAHADEVEAELAAWLARDGDVRVVCDVLRPQIPLACRLYVDSTWVENSDRDELAGWSEALQDRPLGFRALSDESVEAKRLVLPLPFRSSNVVGYTLRVVSGWLQVADTEERLCWVKRLPDLVQALQFAQSGDRLLVQGMVERLLEATLEGGSRLQRWQALLSMVSYLDAQSWMSLESVEELESLYVRGRGHSLAHFDEGFQERIAPVLQKIFVSAVREDSNEVLQHDALMVLLGHLGTRTRTAAMDSERIADAIFQGVGKVERIAGLFSKRDPHAGSNVNYGHSQASLFGMLESNLTSSSRLLLVQALMVLIDAREYSCPLRWEHSENALERRVALCGELLNNRLSLEEQRAFVPAVVEAIARGPAEEQGLLQVWDETATHVLCKWLAGVPEVQDEISWGALSHGAQDILVQRCPVLRGSARYYRVIAEQERVRREERERRARERFVAEKERLRQKNEWAIEQKLHNHPALSGESLWKLLTLIRQRVEDAVRARSWSDEYQRYVFFSDVTQKVIGDVLEIRKPDDLELLAKVFVKWTKENVREITEVSFEFFRKGSEGAVSAIEVLKVCQDVFATWDFVEYSEVFRVGRPFDVIYETQEKMSKLFEAQLERFSDEELLIVQEMASSSCADKRIEWAIDAVLMRRGYVGCNLYPERTLEGLDSSERKELSLKLLQRLEQHTSGVQLLEREELGRLLWMLSYALNAYDFSTVLESIEARDAVSLAQGIYFPEHARLFYKWLDAGTLPEHDEKFLMEQLAESSLVASPQIFLRCLQWSLAGHIDLIDISRYERPLGAEFPAFIGQGYGAEISDILCEMLNSPCDKLQAQAMFVWVGGVAPEWFEVGDPVGALGGREFVFPVKPPLDRVLELMEAAHRNAGQVNEDEDGSSARSKFVFRAGLALALHFGDGETVNKLLEIVDVNMRFVLTHIIHAYGWLAEHWLLQSGLSGFGFAGREGSVLSTLQRDRQGAERVLSKAFDGLATMSALDCEMPLLVRVLHDYPGEVPEQLQSQMMQWIQSSFHMLVFPRMSSPLLASAHKKMAKAVETGWYEAAIGGLD